MLLEEGLKLATDLSSLFGVEVLVLLNDLLKQLTLGAVDEVALSSVLLLGEDIIGEEALWCRV